MTKTNWRHGVRVKPIGPPWFSKHFANLLTAGTTYSVTNVVTNSRVNGKSVVDNTLKLFYATRGGIQDGQTQPEQTEDDELEEDAERILTGVLPKNDGRFDCSGYLAGLRFEDLFRSSLKHRFTNLI